MTDFVNQVICGDSAQELKKLPDGFVDLIVTSPPYDDLRDYDGYTFDFQAIARELFRVTKDGGVLVWVVGDKVEDGSETGTSFKQALFFKEIGFKLHDTMIYQRNPRFPDQLRYNQVFDYMFVLSKGKPKTFNPIKDKKNKYGGLSSGTNTRQQNGDLKKNKRVNINPFGVRDNIWSLKSGYGKSTKDENAYEHPAIFPEPLPKDHIITWSNDGDLVLDPFAGSGTVLKMARLLNRNYIGVEISRNYCTIIEKRIAKHNNQRLESFFAIQE